MKIISSIILGGSLLLASTAFAAPSPSEQVYLLPRWFVSQFKYEPNALSCLAGQADYQDELLHLALVYKNSKSHSFSKKSYYDLATILGYFSDNPVGKDAIVEKVKGTIDADFSATAARLSQANYVLIVGDYGGGYHGAISSTLRGNYSATQLLPAIDGDYDWVSNTFRVSAESRLTKGIYASSKEWKDKWQPLFASADKTLASRLLLGKDLHPLLAEIFDRQTGKTVLSWAAEGMDVNKLQALVPDTPAADYDFNKCDSLNPDYYKKTLGESNTDGSDAVNNAIQGFFGKLMGK
jgi:hypothetical protein